MSDIILHHYPQSPFAEKVRLLLGYKQLSYAAVTIPVIMPKPDLIPLTGGYRKTPVMQIGADIYCDTALICRVIDRLAPEPGIYPAATCAVSAAATQWTDSVFFRVCVTLAFQPHVLATSELFQDPASAKAFMADRAKLTEGAGSLVMDLACAQASFAAHMKLLDRQLAGAPFLFGERPVLADFATYHCCWFVHSNELLRETFSPFPHVEAWLARMAAFGHGGQRPMTGAEALGIARAATPSSDEKAATAAIDHLQIGDEVEVMPTDYGFQPVRGRLQLSSLDEVVVRRTDEQVGEVAVHFPRLGFQLRKVADG